MYDNCAFSEGGLSEPKVGFSKAGFFQVKRISFEPK